MDFGNDVGNSVHHRCYAVCATSTADTLRSLVRLMRSAGQPEIDEDEHRYNDGEPTQSGEALPILRFVSIGASGVYLLIS